MNKLIVMMVVLVLSSVIALYAEELECPPGFDKNNFNNEEWKYEHVGGPGVSFEELHYYPLIVNGECWVRKSNGKIEMVVDKSTRHYELGLELFNMFNMSENDYLAWLQFYFIVEKKFDIENFPCEFVFYEINNCYKTKSCYLLLDQTKQIVCRDNYDGIQNTEYFEYNNAYYLQRGRRTQECGTSCCAVSYTIDIVDNVTTVVSQSVTMIDGCFDDHPIFDCLTNIQNQCITNCK